MMIMMMKHVSREDGGGGWGEAPMLRGYSQKILRGCAARFRNRLPYLFFLKKHTQFKNRVQKSLLIYALNG